ncbi:hypothetical protein KLP40_18845 [Hymenobacter sp. NST-14]|uniref:hypothetical protein n=1 Tax=Hymenobacter piscis TaxID=2839984 RepID=UPI001C023443|nr:hypothetical protein [Hymenobacter piscis]MBT9395234.1 hypothetical protein [Hymenobacter piscis]
MQKTEHWQRALDHLQSGQMVSIVVAGHPKVLADFLQQVFEITQANPTGHGELYLYYYDEQLRNYFVQVYLVPAEKESAAGQKIPAEKEPVKVERQVVMEPGA